VPILQKLSSLEVSVFSQETRHSARLAPKVLATFATNREPLANLHILDGLKGRPTSTQDQICHLEQQAWIKLLTKIRLS
jgi:hypothetical protein